ADQGDSSAEIKIGMMFLEGQGVPQDDAEGAAWVRKAADRGDAEGQLGLDLLYIWGKGLPQDRAAGIEWLKKSAAQGNENAKTRLAEIQGEGHGASTDDARTAFQFLKRQVTIDRSAVENPEPGLSRIEIIDGDNLCRLRCGFHIAAGFQAVADIESEFDLSNVALNTLKWEIDTNNRGFLTFASARGASSFRRRTRTRKAEVITFKPLSEWTKWSAWEATDRVVCRTKANKADIQRA